MGIERAPVGALILFGAQALASRQARRETSSVEYGCAIGRSARAMLTDSAHHHPPSGITKEHVLTIIQAFPRTSVPARLADSGDSIEHQLAALHAMQHEHVFWNCRLLAAFAQGALSRDDMRYVFSQYHLYSSGFTRYIAAVMANCESDLFRAQLAQNLW
ncbi:MAG TPA: hypothetical protein VF469_03525, partial [Kofleriaceae bacterium]